MQSYRMTTSTDTTSPSRLQLLKTDTLFRVRTPAIQRAALLDLHERGTLSAKAFAAAHGIKPHLCGVGAEATQGLCCRCGHGDPEPGRIFALTQLIDE